MRDSGTSKGPVIIIPPAVLRRIGARAVEMIKANTLSGMDANGKPFLGYSTRGFARPVGGVPRSTLKRLEREGSVDYFFAKQKSGGLWMYVEEGYIEFKRARNPEWNGTVDLSDTGEMLRALEVMKIESNTVTIGFKTAEAAAKAYYHNVAGAGKRKTIRKFLGLPKKDMDEIRKMVEEGIKVQF